MSDLLLRIARCENVALARCSSKNSCHTIVMSQPPDAESFQMPEPWNDRLASAPLLFLSSNPSIGEGAEYPKDSWPDHEIEDFFTNRFGRGRKAWVEGGNRALLLDGTYARANAFWSGIRRRAMELFDCAVVPGRDYALTEVVRCKSLRENGVQEARDECARRYMIPTLQASGAVVIVTLGKVAEKYARRDLMRFEGSVSPPTVIAGRERVIAVLPHPNARMKRSCAECLSDPDVALLRARLARALHGS
jgi:hypothetical protein